MAKKKRSRDLSKEINVCAYSSFSAEEPIAKGKTIDEALEKARDKGVKNPYIMEELPEGVTAFF